MESFLIIDSYAYIPKIMKQELFNKYILDASRWLKKSRELMIAARYLVAIHAALYRNGKDVISTTSSEFDYHPFQAWASVSNSAALLLGLALENLIKAHLVSIGKIKIDEGNKIQGLTGNHNLSRMLAEAECQLSEEEERSIAQLTFQLQTLSKYHLAKNAAKQSEFSGCTDNPQTIYDLIVRIAKRLLTDEHVKQWMARDESYDHISERPFFN
ncbi:MAG: hypothetical protein VKJ02_16535 [Snowella sp.]|nr:hypothetical protein [Snowella sp.]